MNESMFLEVPYGNVIGKWVTYWGSNKSWHGKDFKIVDQGKDKHTANRIAFMVPGAADPVWRTLGPSFGEPFSKVEQEAAAQAIDDLLFNPHAETKRTIDNEIKRLKARIAELEATRKVLDTL